MEVIIFCFVGKLEEKIKLESPLNNEYIVFNEPSIYISSKKLPFKNIDFD